jgi:hypothetical protein
LSTDKFIDKKKLRNIACILEKSDFMIFFILQFNGTSISSNYSRRFFFFDQKALIFFEFYIRIGQYSAPIFLFRPYFEKFFAFFKSRKFPKFHMGTFTLIEQSMLIQKFFYGEKLFSGVSKFFDFL